MFKYPKIKADNLAWTKVSINHGFNDNNEKAVNVNSN